MIIKKVGATLAFSAVALIFIWAVGVHAQERPLTQRVIQSGHSLTDGVLDPLRKMVEFAGSKSVVVDQSTIPGSPMDYRWNNAPGWGQPDARHDIARYDTLVLTERVPLGGPIKSHNSLEEALRWFSNAWLHGNDGKGSETILYATWVSIDSGPDYENPWNDSEGHISFRDRLPLEMARWETILIHVNNNRPDGSPPMRMIPGPSLMAAIYDEIASGNAPELTHISDLFSDDIHLNEFGNYYVALAHFAIIYGRDPRGMQNFGEVTADQASWMQDLVWRVLSE